MNEKGKVPGHFHGKVPPRVGNLWVLRAQDPCEVVWTVFGKPPGRFFPPRLPQTVRRGGNDLECILTSKKDYILGDSHGVEEGISWQMREGRLLGGTVGREESHYEIIHTDFYRLREKDC